MMRKVCRCCLLLAVALIAMLARPVQAQDAPVLRVTASAPAQGQTGATIKLQLEVMTSTWFTQPPQLPKLELPGVTVTPPSGHGDLVRGELDGQPLNGLRYTYLLSVESAGALHIPALRVTAQVGQASAPVTSESAPLTIKITGGARQGNVVGDLSVTQSYTLTPDPMVQGGRITRSVTQRADGVQPMLLPPAPLEDIPHFKRYPREPEVITLTDGRGGFVGAQRIDRADYVAQEPGSFALPSLTLHWTDARTGSAKNQTLPGRQVEVAAAQATPPPFSLEADLATLRHGLRWAIPDWAMPVIIELAAAGLALWLGRGWWQRLVRALGAAAKHARARWLASETSLLARLAAGGACRASGPERFAIGGYGVAEGRRHCARRLLPWRKTIANLWKARCGSRTEPTGGRPNGGPRWRRAAAPGDTNGASGRARSTRCPRN